MNVYARTEKKKTKTNKQKKTNKQNKNNTKTGQNELPVVEN